jgi:hypothetical protein
MIHFNYTHPQGTDHEGKIVVSLDERAREYYSSEQFPLHLMHKDLSGRILWSTDLFPGVWSSYTMLTYTTLEVVDSLGNKIIDWKWDAFSHGDFAHQLFEIWALNNKGSNGLAIGTHNGMTGEWVGPVIKGRLQATLVEASEPQFNDLVKYYNGKSWVNCKKELITSDGFDVVYYEGGAGFTNSMSKDIIQNYVEESFITSTLKSSKSINDLIIESSEKGKVRWLHIDVEGMDGELIYSINDDLLPELLLFESLHMENEYYDNLCSYLTNKGYSITKSGWNTICIK